MKRWWLLGYRGLRGSGSNLGPNWGHTLGSFKKGEDLKGEAGCVWDKGGMEDGVEGGFALLYFAIYGFRYIDEFEFENRLGAESGQNAVKRGF